MRDLLTPDDTRDALRKLGGLLFGTGMLMWFLRKSEGAFGEPYGDLALLLILLVAFVVLYGGGVLLRGETDSLRPWQSVMSVFGLILFPFLAFQFLSLIDGNTGAALNIAWIFALTAALAAYAGLVAGIRFHLLAGGIAFVIAWIAFWDKVIGFDDDVGLLRGFFGLAAIVLLAVGIQLSRAEGGNLLGMQRFGELFTVAGLAAVVACAMSIVNLGGVGLPVVPAPEAQASLLWDTLLLLVSLALIGIGANMGVRGPVYVGAIGLAAFLLIAGSELRLDFTEREGSFVGWPLLLIALGLGALALSLVKDVTLGDRPRRQVDSLMGKRGGLLG